MSKRSRNSRLRFICETSALALLAGTVVVAPATAREIGVTAAVRPDVLGTPPDQESRILSVGTDVNANERIETSKIGQTHLLFIDGSALSVGPGASLVLDKFVYDPDSKTGELVVSASKGLMRFVGGALSKKKPILIKTPTATIGVRGGVAVINAGGAGAPPSVTMLFGEEVFMESNGQRQTMRRPGYRITQDPGGGINAPQQVTQEQLNEALQALEEPPQSPDGENLGDIAPAGGGVPVTDEDVAGSQMGNLGSSNDPNSLGGITLLPPSDLGTPPIDDEINEPDREQAMGDGESDEDPSSVDSGDQFPLPPGTPTFFNSNELGFGLVVHGATGGTPVGLVAQLEGVTSGSTFALVDDDGGRFTINSVTGVISVAEGAEIDFKANRAHFVRVRITAPDGTVSEVDAPSIEVAYPFYVGRAKRSTSGFVGTTDTDGTQNFGVDSSVAVFQYYQAGGLGLFFPDAPGTYSVNQSNVLGLPNVTPFGLTVAEGTVQLTDDQEFFIYKLLLSDESRVLAFGGDTTTSFPTSGVSAYTLDSDFVRSSELPFVDSIGSTRVGDFFIAWEGGGSGASGGGFVTIQGQGTSQRSGMAAVSGRVLPGSGIPHMAAAFFGSIRDAGGPNDTFFGPLSTSDAGSVSTSPDFFGTSPDYFVLEASNTDANDVVGARGAFRRANDSVSVYFPNSAAFANPASTAGASRSSRNLNGFASSLFVSTNGMGGIVGVDHLRGTSSNDVQITTNAANNTIDTAFRLDSTEDSFIYQFGSSSGSGTGAFIDDNLFFASGSSISYNDGEIFPAVEGELGLVTSGVFHHEGFLPSGVTLCDCQHITWGFFGVDQQLQGGTSAQRSLAHLGTWVAGELSNAAQLVGIAPQMATYTGHIIGGVYNNGNFYHAAGSMSLSFTFGGGNFALNSVAISNFDGTNFTSSLNSSPGSFATNAYNSTTADLSITGTHPTAGNLTATVNGAFFGPGTPPIETGGTANISGTNYKAETTFATKLPPS